MPRHAPNPDGSPVLDEDTSFPTRFPSLPSSIRRVILRRHGARRRPNSRTNLDNSLDLILPILLQIIIGRCLRGLVSGRFRPTNPSRENPHAQRTQRVFPVGPRPGHNPHAMGDTTAARLSDTWTRLWLKFSVRLDLDCSSERPP